MFFKRWRFPITTFGNDGLILLNKDVIPNLIWDLQRLLFRPGRPTVCVEVRPLGHPRVFLSGIYTLCFLSGGDSRLRPSGMTPYVLQRARKNKKFLKSA